MAGSRLEKFGTVFTRVRDLMRSRVLKQKDKPVWYDVYQAFPPKREPLYVKPQSRYIRKQEVVPEIFYREDQIRAKFYEQYGPGPRLLDLTNASFVPLCQRFVDKYTELESQSQLDEAALIEETAKALLAEGVTLRRKGAVSAASKDPLLRVKLTDMLAEQQSLAANRQNTTEPRTQKNTT